MALSMKTSAHNNLDNDKRVALLSGTIAVIDTAKAVVPSALVQSILSTVSNILAIAKNTLQNEDDFRGLIEQCRVICDVVARVTEGQTDGDFNSELSDIIISLKSFVQSIYETVVSANERSVIKRALFALSDKDKIASWVRELDRRVLLNNMHLSMITQRRIDQLSRQINRPSVSTTDEGWRVVLPSVPSPFFGRGHLIPHITELLLKRRHVTLCGPGGIGKSSLAKAVIHGSVMAERFQGRRYFVSLDELDGSHISTGTVKERICRAAGLDGRLGERWEEVMAFLTGADTVLVIDHADALTAARNANSVARLIDDLASSSSVVLLLTTRSKHPIAPYLITQIVSVPTLERKYAREAFEHVCPQHIPVEIIDELLDGVDNHPLSVNILARRAVQHEWSGAELLSAWRTQRAVLLENGERKSHSLRATVELSLNAPLVIGLGDDARKLLDIIAFFPQGLDAMRVKALCPSATAIADALSVHSMIHREGTRFTMLAPMRLYLGQKTPNPDSGFLNTIRNMYYKELSGNVERHQALIEAEDVNVERLITFDFSMVINLDDSCRACASFLDNLAIYKPRATILTTMFQELPVKSSGILAKVTSRHATTKAVSLRNKTLLVKSAGTLASSLRRSTLTSTFLRTLFVRVNLQNGTSTKTKNLRTSVNPRRLRHLQTVTRPFLRLNRQSSSTITPTTTIKCIHSCASLQSFNSLLQEHRGVLAFFTTEMCRLSRKAQPLFEEFAHDKNSSGSPVAFVQVDLNSSRGAAAVGIELGVRATPTFLFFVGGMKVYEIQGCDVQQLRMHLGMFLHPVHPHLSISFPAMEQLSLKPIEFKKVHDLAVVSAKLRGFLDSTTNWFQPFDTSLSKVDTMEILFRTMIPYIEAFTTSQRLPLHPLFDLWHDVTSCMSWNMPQDQLFPLVDLWRIALLDEKVSSWCANRNGLDSPLGLLLSKACEWSSKNYLLTLLRMLSNAFINRALGWKMLLSAQNNLAILLEHTLVHEDLHTRKNASSLAFNIFARLQELRVENLCKGDEEEADHLEMELSLSLLNAEWEASIACALLVAIERESDGEIVRRQVAALGLIVRFSPFIDHLLRLLGALHAQSILRTKLRGNGGDWNMEESACVLLQEVADKLCPPSVLV